jgi:GH15 family glucan-1,4-alpha-glucosidase
VDYQPPAWISEGLVEAISTLAAQALRYRDTPDRGIWELRSEPGHLLHSKALLWVALDRAVKMGQRMGGFAPAQLQEWRHAADALRAEYEREAWNEARGAWMQAYGSEVLDASVLRTVLFDALDVEDPRLGSTLAAVDRELLEGDLVYRYRMDDDGFEGEEATFTACAFWRVGVMALAGRTAPAKALFERLLARANDVGLFAEEIDAATGEQRGNVPQGFTHMCVINHAVRLEGCITQYGLVG